MSTGISSEDKVRVLHVMSSARLAGSENALLMLLENANMTRFDHTVVLPEDGPLRVEVERCGARPAVLRRGSFSPAFHARVVWLMLRLRPHILHVHTSRLQAIPARIMGIKTIERKNLTRESFHNTPSRNPAYDRLGNTFIQLTITPSEYLRDYYIDRGLASKDRIFVVRNGINLEPYDEPFDREAKLSELGLGAGTEPLCAVGRLVPIKGFNDLVAAMPLILEKHPAAHLLLLGDGPEAARLHEQASRLGVDGNITFAGHRRDVPRILRISRGFVHSSRTEALSNAVLESMAARCPTAVSDIPGNREIVRHEETGLLFPPGDSKAMAAAVCRILDDAALANTITRNARTLVETRFKKESMASETEMLYLKLLSL